MEVDEKTMQALLHRIELLESANLPKELRTYVPGVWNDWSGGEPPVKDWQTLVDIEQRSKEILTTTKVGAHRWDWTYGKYNDWDIIRFCIVTNKENLERMEAITREHNMTREERVSKFQHYLAELFKDGPPDSSYGDSALKENMDSSAHHPAKPFARSGRRSSRLRP